MTHRGSYLGLTLCISLITILLIEPANASGWILDGNPIVITPRNQIEPVAASDGMGGAIIVWQDSRNSTGEYHSFDIYAQRVNAEGTPLWAQNGVPVCTLPGGDSWPGVIADGVGGAIIVWTRTTGAPAVYWDIYAQRIDSAGNALWALNGMPVGANPGFESEPTLMDDGARGAIFAWHSDTDIYVQRIAADGSRLWTSNGLGLCVKPGGQYGPVITTDGAGGAIVAWSDTTSNVSGYDIFARRVTSNGTPLWASTGVPICTAPSYQYDATIVDDGVGGAVISWYDTRDGVSGGYVQRVNGSGAVQWAANGIAMHTGVGPQTSGTLLRLSDNILVVWGRPGGLYAQKIDLAGNKIWDPYGVSLCTFGGAEPRMVADGDGGAIITWQDSRGVDVDVYAQRIDQSGQIQWIPDGTAVCTADEWQVNLEIATDGAEGAIVTWADGRSGVDPDVYAHHLGPHGPTLTAVEHPPSASSINVLPNRPNPFGESSVIEVELVSPSDVVVEVFDAMGRRVRSDRWPEREAGWNLFDIRARDQRGRILPSGVYFLRVSTNQGIVTHKIVITR